MKMMLFFFSFFEVLLKTYCSVQIYFPEVVILFVSNKVLEHTNGNNNINNKMNRIATIMNQDCNDNESGLQR